MRFGVLLLYAVAQGAIAHGVNDLNKRSENTLAPNANAGQTGADAADIQDGVQDAAAADEVGASQADQQVADKLETAKGAESASAGSSASPAAAGSVAGAQADAAKSEKAGMMSTSASQADAAKAGKAGMMSISASQADAAKAAKAGMMSTSSTQTQAGKDAALSAGSANVGAGSLEASTASTPRVEKQDETGELSTPGSNAQAADVNMPSTLQVPDKQHNSKTHIEKEPDKSPGAVDGPQNGRGPTLQPVPMAMVHNEVQPGVPHTGPPYENIMSQMLPVAVEPSTMLELAAPAYAAQHRAPGLVAPKPKNAQPTPAPVRPPVQGAMFAAGPETFTASLDNNMNIVLGGQTLKIGGPPITLANGAAVVSIVPGGALNVDGSIITMSSIHPAATNTVLTINNHAMTATPQHGSGGSVMILGTATLLSNGPVQTVEGVPVVYDEHGVHVVSSASKISDRPKDEAATATAWLTVPRGPAMLKPRPTPGTGLADIPDPTETAKTGPRIEQHKNAAGVLGASVLSVGIAFAALASSLLLFAG